MKTFFTSLTFLLVNITIAQNKQTDSTVYQPARIYDEHTVKFLMPDSVFICDSSSATKFHLKPDCKGLTNCKHPIIKVDYIYIINHRELCGYEK
tara:strand:+ start:383 stop:664 length:282 start_codon:yes stop_codon:yes gene_type:complete